MQICYILKLEDDKSNTYEIKLACTVGGTIRVGQETRREARFLCIFEILIFNHIIFVITIKQKSV